MSSAANGLLYTTNFDNVSVTNAAQDIWEFVCAATVSCLIHSIRVTFEPTITSGVAQDVRAQLRICVRSTTGSGGSAVTPRAVNPRMTVAASTTTTRTVTTPGTVGNIWSSDMVSIIVPYERIYTPAQRLLVPSATRLCLNLENALGAAYDCSSEVYFEEL